MKIHSIFFFGILTLITCPPLWAQPVLTLTEAVNLGLQKNLGLQLAANDTSIAQTQNNWGNAGRLPTVAAAAGYNFSLINLDQRLANGTNFKRDGATFQGENASINAVWRVYNGGRVTAAKSRLETLEDISQLQYRQQANVVVYDIITAYLNILRLQSQLKASNESLLLFEERMRLAQNRFNIGTAGKSDYLQALTDFNQVRNSILDIENNIERSKVILNTLLARNPNEPFATSDVVTQVPLGTESSYMAALDSLNPSMLIAQSQLKVLQQQYKEINAQRLPTVTLNAGAGINNNNNSSGFTLRNTTYGPSGGVGVAIPIFQGNVVKQNLKVNQIQQQSQQVNLQQLRNTLSAGVANAFNNYENASKQLELEQANLQVVKENNVIAMERFRKATITTVELRQVQLNLIESQTRMINAQYNMKQAEADVLVIVGKLVE